MTSQRDSLAFLQRERPRWVDIEVEVGSPQANGAMSVRSTHTTWTGRRRAFSITWPDPHRLDTEYGYGLSFLHDIKDHTLYGLNITDLTEFQTIVQTYYGREVAGGRSGRAPDHDFKNRILQALVDELHGPRGPRVYGPLETGLFDLEAPIASEAARQAAFGHMAHVCLAIMMPVLAEVYARNETVRRLQASTRDQPLLVDTFLPGIKWHSKEDRLMRLIDNAGARLSARAYIDDDLAAVSARLADRIREHVAENADLLAGFGSIFDTRDYLLPGAPESRSQTHADTG